MGGIWPNLNYTKYEGSRVTSCPKPADANIQRLCVLRGYPISKIGVILVLVQKSGQPIKVGKFIPLIYKCFFTFQVVVCDIFHQQYQKIEHK